jgi:hypothetical protein
VPKLPEVSDAGEPEHQIELLQGAWTQLTTQAEQLKTQLQQAPTRSRAAALEVAREDAEDSTAR